MKPRKGVSIGQDKWIEWIDFNPKSESILEVDGILDSTDVLWKNLETACVVACCGIDALEFWPDDIQEAAKSLDKTKLRRTLQAARDTIAASEQEVVSSDILNSLFDKQVFLDLLDHILHNIKE